MKKQGKNSKDHVKILIMGHTNGGRTTLINQLNNLLAQERTSELDTNPFFDKTTEKEAEEGKKEDGHKV